MRFNRILVIALLSTCNVSFGSSIISSYSGLYKGTASTKDTLGDKVPVQIKQNFRFKASYTKSWGGFTIFHEGKPKDTFEGFHYSFRGSRFELRYYSYYLSDTAIGRCIVTPRKISFSASDPAGDHAFEGTIRKIGNRLQMTVKRTRIISGRTDVYTYKLNKVAEQGAAANP